MAKFQKKVFKKIIYLTISVDRGKLYKSIDDRCLKIIKSNAVNEVSSFLKKKKKKKSIILCTNLLALTLLRNI